VQRADWFPQREYATAVGFSFAFNPLGAAIGIPVVTWLLLVFDNEWRRSSSWAGSAC
jgi:MFS family permease